MLIDLLWHQDNSSTTVNWK